MVKIGPLVILRKHDTRNGTFSDEVLVSAPMLTAPLKGSMYPQKHT